MLEAFLALLTELTTIPETTALLANYPNPFNPETWIPYHLATDTDVIVRIYDMSAAAWFGSWYSGISLRVSMKVAGVRYIGTAETQHGRTCCQRRVFLYPHRRRFYCHAQTFDSEIIFLKGRGFCPSHSHAHVLDNKAWVKTHITKENLRMKMRTVFSFLIVLFLVSTLNITTSDAQDAPQLINTLIGHDWAVLGVAFSPDSTTIASGSSDHTVILWDPRTGNIRHRLSHTFYHHAGDSVWDVAFNSDGTRLASITSGGVVRLWNAETGALQNIFHHDQSGASLAFSPDGATVATGGGENTVRFWDVATGEVRYTLEGHTDTIYSLAFSPDGRILASGAWDGTVRLWNAETGALLNTLRLDLYSRVHSVDFSPDGTTLVGAQDSYVHFWDAATGTRRNTIDADNVIQSVAFSPDGTTVAGGGNAPEVFLWDVATGTRKHTLTEPQGVVTSVDFSPDGTMLAAGTWADKAVYIWQLPATNAPLTFTPSTIADRTFTVGTAVSLTLPTATGGTAPYTYTLSPIPAGLSFDTATQLLSGTPTTATPATLATYTATDAAGATAALRFSITVTSGGGIDEPRPVPPDVRQIFGLDPFYQQYINVGGLPVVASVQTNPYALKEAAWLIQQMIGHRPDVLQALAQNRVRFSVMAYTEMTTQIPEYSNLVPGFYWDIHDRAWQATSQRPAVSCGEENLLQYPGAPYWNENLLVHVLSHALHEMGLNTIDAGFDHRLSEAFNAAIAQGLWQGTYAGRNRQRYWAEGAQSWFNTNRENDAHHNAINTRAELKVYDPALAALLTEVFGDREWRYTLPETRVHLPHLQGFDPQASPTFQWPPDALACYQQLTDPEMNSCGDKWVNVEAHPPSGLPGLKSPSTPTESAIIFVNRTGAPFSYYWIDFDGNEQFYGRFVDAHVPQHTFAGHIWLIKDDTGKHLAVFHAVEQTGRAIVSTTDRIFISPVSPQTFEVGTAVHLTLPVATGGTSPYTYSVSALPAGLYFDAVTRVLSGTPTTPTPATPVTYTATDATGQTASLTFTIEVTGTGAGNLDVDGDGQVTVIDLAVVAMFYGTRVPVGVPLAADVNTDGVVNLLDLTAVAQAIDAAGGVNGLPLQAAEVALLAAVEQAAEIEGVAGAPMGLRTHVLSGRSVYANVVAALMDVKHLATGDVRLGKAFVVLSELLQLLAELTAIPETTALLPNYPNPFNPETWIPYHLSKDAEVKLTIYDMRGVAVRVLVFGHQPAGVYERRGRAAYWDGRNSHGEPVASGVYFYTLTAGDFTATRKLLIAK